MAPILMRILNGLNSILRGVWLLRNPQLVRRLGQQHAALKVLEQARTANPGAIIDDGVLLVAWREGALKLAAGVRVEHGSVLALGDALNGWGRLAVGEGTWIGEYNNFRLAGSADISIGRDCLVSQFCSLVASNHDTRGRGVMSKLPPDEKKRGISIGNNVWLGAGCVVLPGVTIEDGAVVGANSVVTKSVPAFEIWAGQPALKVADRS
jgi:acetyltransferase-like isoleucine patch superfamily enzyme